METLATQLSANFGNVVPFMILLLPLLGFTVLALLGDRIQREGNAKGAGLLACATVLTSFVLSLWTVHHLQGLLFTPPAGAPRSQASYAFAQPFLGFSWIEAGSLRVPINLLVDHLSSVMILVVTGVGSLIHIYSLGYMSHDEESVRYFSYLNLFTFFMLVLVLGGNLPLMFVGWEGVGLCSYLLIGFWYRKQSASDAGKKAFIVNRIGDAGLILGMILAFHQFGTLDFVDLVNNAAGYAPERFADPAGPITWVCLLLFVGACGKSAQIPLHVWLPDAMEGPTPVSALIHAATMVTAGVYMVARLGALYSLSDRAMLVVSVIGATTAFVGATIALVQTDIKKVLAYSTVSQLGYMFLACGVGAFSVGVFHLFTHAFFKALLFLGSGSVIHALSGEQDMRQMGGLRKKIPWTFGTFLIGTAAIAGVPFLSGFYSKEEILTSAFGSGHTILMTVGLITAGMTAFYMTRLLVLTFFGEYRGNIGRADAHAAPDDHHAPAAHGHDDHGQAGIHESPWSMLFPLVVLALGAIAAGWPLWHLPEFVDNAIRLPETREAHAHAGWLTPLAIVIAFVGIVAAYYVYTLYKDLPGRLMTSLRPIHRALEAKWGFDLLYNWIARRVVVDGSETVLWRGLDAGVIDGAVNLSAHVVGAIAGGVRQVQTGLVRGYALVILGGAVIVLGYLLRGYLVFIR